MQKKQRFELAVPVENNGRMMNAFYLRRPKLGDFRAAGRLDNEIDQVCLVAARMAGVGVEVIDELDGEDTERLIAEVGRAIAAFAGR